MVKKNYKIILLLGLSTAFFSITFFNYSSVASIPQSNQENNQLIASIPIPDELLFAEEKVPLWNFDTRESLDRELSINVYWHSQTLLFIKKANRYFPLISPILEEYGIPDDMKYLALAESGLSNAVSPAGAKGFWQFLDGTAGDYGLEVNEEVDERFHIEKSTIAAAKFLRESYNKFGSWAMAAASYNMGRTNLIKQVERQKSSNYYDLVLGDETGRYVFRLMALKLIIEHPEKYGFRIDESELYPQIPFKIITVDSSISNLADFAKQNGINYKMLKELNPWLRDNQLTNPKKKKYEIKIMQPDFRPVIQDTAFYK
jgi:hypothetical protein